MIMPRRIVTRGVLATGVLLGTCVARADVTGSFDGQVAARTLAQPLAAAAALSQSGAAVVGTVVLGGDAASLGGAYLVQGRATSRRVKLSGLVNGATLAWRAKVTGDVLQGKLRVRKPGTKLLATLVLTRNVSVGDGSGCDPVFAQNETFFVEQVLGQALTSCTACHVPGGQAQATRLHVAPSDPLATARAIALLVDSADPASSRVLEKPLGLLPHGGGQQITAGSTQDQLLRQWVGLVAQAHCN